MLVVLELVVELEKVAVTGRARRRDADGDCVPDFGLAGRARLPNGIVLPDVNLVADKDVEVLALQRRFLVGVDVNLLPREVVAYHVLVNGPLLGKASIGADDGDDVVAHHGRVVFRVGHDAVHAVRYRLHCCNG